MVAGENFWIFLDFPASVLPLPAHAFPVNHPQHVEQLPHVVAGVNGFTPQRCRMTAVHLAGTG